MAEGFGEKAGSAGRQELAVGILFGVAAVEKDPGLGINLLDRQKGFFAVFYRHDQVKEDEINFRF